MDEYIKQAEKFLKETNTEFKAEFLKHGFHFEDDKEQRDVYLITLKRGDRTFKFNFGQSLNKSWSPKYRQKVGHLKKHLVEIIPNAYDVLSCLTKNEVGSFKDFCDNFGYDNDSIKAEKIYKAVLNEWNNVKMLYTDEEILKLQEIE